MAWRRQRHSFSHRKKPIFFKGKILKFQFIMGNFFIFKVHVDDIFNLLGLSTGQRRQRYFPISVFFSLLLRWWCPQIYFYTHILLIYLCNKKVGPNLKGRKVFLRAFLFTSKFMFFFSFAKQWLFPSFFLEI